jgi:large subunit ribosomal protein L14
MKGIAGRQTRGVIKGTYLDCIDNTGAKKVQIIDVPKYHGTARRYPSAGIADLLIVTVKRGTPEMRRQILHAVLVRQRRRFRRTDGLTIQFEDNACVITTETGETKGTDIKGPVAREAAERWPRIAATASIIV